jgi:hypothetical protein
MKLNIDEKFFKYHEKNPHVFDLFYKYTMEVKAKGFDHYSTDAIMHRIRWHRMIETDINERFKMNDNYTSRYARLLVEKYPELDGFFRNRQLKTPSILNGGE